MVQLSVTENTFTKLNLLKTKSIVHKQGKSVTWNNIIEALIETSNYNENLFLENIKNQNGKKRKNE